MEGLEGREAGREGEGRSEGEERLTTAGRPRGEGGREGWNGYCESQAAASVLCLSECGVGAGVSKPRCYGNIPQLNYRSSELHRRNFGSKAKNGF